MPLFLYLLFIFGEILFLLFFLGYVSTLTYSILYGSFYVATKNKETKAFLKEAGLKKGQYFLELGSGDGRVLRIAAKEYGVVGKGIDINPVLNFWANFRARSQHLKDVTFTKENVLKTDFSKADVIYIFLMPKLIKKFDDRLAKEARKGTLIISHGFTVPALEKKLKKTIEHKPFPTYFYKI
jgi:SAM-dependent methyltransferase